MSLQSVRGTRDLKGDNIKSFLNIIEKARQLSQRFGFEELETPIFEFTDVFKRTLGDASDIVTKEMYTFNSHGTDGSGDSLTLRPEGTAPIARSVISSQLFRDLPLKYFYQGPMFRHERPQKGRYRQFYQLGVELIGVASPVADAEVISMGWELLGELGLQKNISLELNSLGDTQSRNAYREALTSHFEKCKPQLSAESQTRLTKNPLRILDSKSKEDQPFIAEAPNMKDVFTKESSHFFDQLCNLLTHLNIPFKLNPTLVRGLDYYCHSVFEFTTKDLGAQNAVLSGGRYDGLIETMGGPSTPGVGWAAGIDRLSLLTSIKTQLEPVVGVIPLTSADEAESLKIMNGLRREGFTSSMPYSGNLSKRLKKLGRLNCAMAIIVGGDQEQRGDVQIKNFSSGEQSSLPKKDLTNHVQSTINKILSGKD